MRKFIFLLSVIASTTIVAQTAAIPDSNFEQALIDLGIDSNGLNGNILLSDAQNITSLSLFNQNISDLTGIEAFINLAALFCADNQLTFINLSQNTSLASLNLEANQLSTLDLSQNSSLGFIYCADNLITNLDVSNTPFLLNLDVSNNQLMDLNIQNGNNSNVNLFDARNNPNLNCIQVDNVGYSDANWTNIDSHTSFSEECSGGLTFIPDDNFEQALIDLEYDSGPLDDFVSTENINTITNLNVSNKDISDLTGIEDFAALTFLFCGNNQLTNLEISQNLSLTLLECSNNLLTNIDITQNLVLTYLGVGNNQLTTIDVTQNSMLVELFVNSNQLSNLSANQNSQLILIDCEDNLLTTLELGQNNLLEELYCRQNQLTTLDLSQNNTLTDLDCINNQLTSLNIKNGNNTNILSYFSTDNPNLNCVEVDNAAYSSANWTEIDPQTDFSEDCGGTQTYIPDDNFEQALIDLEYDSGPLDDFVPTETINTVTNLNIQGKGISDLTGIADFAMLIQLICRDNQLTSIDISQNLALTDLQCGQNQITTLDVSQNVFLRNINCFSNQLTSLDISQNTVLTNINCNTNLITALDTSQNLDLIQMICYGNQLTSLDVSQNTILLGLVCSVNQLTSLNTKNGNNVNMTNMIATDNPNLNCIEVDNVAYSETNWTSIDAQTIFSEDCSALNINNFNIENPVTIYPNPASHIVHIETPNNSVVDSIKIVNLAGKHIKIASSNTRIDVSELASGFYILIINIGSQTVIKKLLVE